MEMRSMVRAEVVPDPADVRAVEEMERRAKAEALFYQMQVSAGIVGKVRPRDPDFRDACISVVRTLRENGLITETQRFRFAMWEYFEDHHEPEYDDE